MKYEVTFGNGQVSVYDTPTPFDEFRERFPAAKDIVQLDAPKAIAVAPAPAVEAPKKRVRKSA